MKYVDVTCENSTQEKLVQIIFSARTSTMTQSAYFQEPIVTWQSNLHILHSNAFLGVVRLFYSNFKLSDLFFVSVKHVWNTNAA